MNHLMRGHAPIPDEAWAEIDKEARERLVPALGARKLVDFEGPRGWKYSATNLGRTEEVVDCIDRWWGDMVDRGLTTTEESWNAVAGSWSLCHAWSAHPVVHLSNTLLGIWQTAPGWKTIRFSPTFTKVDRIRGRVATPFGPIESGWDRTGGRTRVFLKLPKGITATVALPGKRPQKMAGRQEWSLPAAFVVPARMPTGRIRGCQNVRP